MDQNYRGVLRKQIHILLPFCQLRPEASASLLLARHSAKKCFDSFGDEVSLFLQSKVPGVEQVKLSFG